MTSLNFHCYINIVEIIMPSAPQTIQSRDDSEIHYFDTAMEIFSIGLFQDFMVDILIINVRVGRTRSGYTTYIDK